MAEIILREKSRRGQNSARGKVQSSRLAESHASHSHETQDVLRNINLEGCGFDQRVTATINSRNFVSQVWLEVTLGDGGSDLFCKHVGLSLLKQVNLRYAGRKFKEGDYEDEMFINMQKMQNPERKAELLRLCGGPASATPGVGGKVIVPIFCYWAQVNKPGFEHGPCWSNISGGASRLELELIFNPKSFVAAGATCTLDSCQLWYQEVLVPASVESTFRGREKIRPRIEYNSINTTVVAGQRKEIDCSQLLAGGNIRCMYFKEEKAGTGPTRDAIGTSRPSAVEVRLNGVELQNHEQPALDMWMLLQRFHLDPTHEQAYCVPFCVNPSERDSSGYLPASQDSLSVYYTAATSTVLRIICEYEKIHRRTEQGRVEKADS